jgi:hypothetical protein
VASGFSRKIRDLHGNVVLESQQARGRHCLDSPGVANDAYDLPSEGMRDGNGLLEHALDRGAHQQRLHVRVRPPLRLARLLQLRGDVIDRGPHEGALGFGLWAFGLALRH